MTIAKIDPKPQEIEMFKLPMTMFLLLAAFIIPMAGCRASLPVKVTVYNCTVAVEQADGTVTLEQCRTVEENSQTTDQQGDDAVDVDADKSSSAGIRAMGPNPIRRTASAARPGLQAQEQW